MVNKNSLSKQELEGRLPPQNIEAEQSVLGCLMLDKKAIIRVADILKPNDFYRGVHNQIYSVMLELYEKGEPIDLLSLTNRLEDKKELEDIGGGGYFTNLLYSLPAAAPADHLS